MYTRTKTYLLAFALLAGAGLVQAAPVKEGDPAPALASHRLEGTLPDCKGRVVVLDFWASWCGPCASSLPALEKLHQKYKDRGVVVIGVSVDDDAAKMQAFLKKHPVSFATVRDAGQSLVAACSIESMPTSIVIGRDGKVVAVHRGFKGKSSEEAWEKDLDRLTGGAGK